MKILIALFSSTLFFISSCSSMTTTEMENNRNELDSMANKAITGLKVTDLSLQGKLDKSLAYGVANMKVTKVPIVGAGSGNGVLFIKEPQQRIYFTVGRFDVGGGWGVRSYKILMVINKQEIVDKLKNGKWAFEAGAEASAGTAAIEGAASTGDMGFTTHVLSDGGASATVTARVIRMKINHQLTGKP